jgi:ABC-type Fe3+/spermidine/putrescine transport system ATPase subunit
LSNLDAKLREQMREELKHMIKLFDMTAVHITHDQDEAMALADRIICMRSGHIEQVGTGRELYREPASRFVADFIGACSFVEGKVTHSTEGKGAGVRTAEGLEIYADRAAAKAPGAPVALAIRPEAITLSTENPGGSNSFPATIQSATFLGSHSEYQMLVAGAALKANSPRDFDVGTKCFVHIDPATIACIDAEPIA